MFGGFVAHAGGKRMAAWLAVGMNLTDALVCVFWRPDEKQVESALARRSSSAAGLTGEALQARLLRPGP